jgi:cytochrome b subunit of formate dehydrogenase
MDLLLGTMVAVTFIAGVSGLVVLLGRDDRTASWYPWPGAAVGRKLLAIAAVAAALAVVTWVFSGVT